MKVIAFVCILLTFSFSAFGQSERIVRAEKGDTVRSLAARYGTDAAEIAVYNGLSEGNTLSEGQQIKLPPAAEPLTRPAEVLPIKSLPANCNFVENVGGEAAHAYKLYFQQDSFKRRGERVEIWTCIEPVDHVSYRGEYKLPQSFSFSLQLVTIDCDVARISMRRIIPYEQTGRPLPVSAVRYGMEVVGEPIIPGSAGHGWKVRLCG